MPTDLIDDDSFDALGPRDDDFHVPAPGRWAHETSWFWWFVPEAGIGAWSYHWVRPNIGVTGGGVWLWDPETTYYFDAPYFVNDSNQPLSPDRNLNNHVFASGLSLKTLEPLTKYRLEFADRDRLRFDLVFDAVLPPWVNSLVGEPAAPMHLDQFGRVSGEMTVHGRTYTVDCIASRDRSWHERDERWKRGAVGYCDAFDPEGGTAFLAISGRVFLPDGRDAEAIQQEEIHSGYLFRDGRRYRLKGGRRRVERDPATGALSRIEIEGRDSHDRFFSAKGVVVSKIMIPNPGVHGIVWITMIRWTLDDGSEAWGQDQDGWPMREWSASRRGRRLP